MKLFEILKFDFADYNKKVMAQSNNTINVPENFSGLRIDFEIEVNNSEILTSFRNKKNILIEDNIIKYSATCINNEIVISIYDYTKRNFEKDSFLKDIEKIVEILNMWEI